MIKKSVRKAVLAIAALGAVGFSSLALTAPAQAAEVGGQHQSSHQWCWDRDGLDLGLHLNLFVGHNHHDGGWNNDGWGGNWHRGLLGDIL